MNLPEFLGVEQNELVETITEAIGLIILILGVIYMLDFFTLGLLKRIKWIEKPYYYLYVAMGWITLARFYRPLYYNFTDNSFGRKFAVILPFCVMIIYFGSAVEYVGSAYTPGVLGDGRVWINNNSYDDANDALASRVWGPSLSSKYAKNDYIECFVPYIPTRDDETLLLRNDDLNPARMPGFVLRGKGPHIGESVNQNADFDALLEAMAELHQLRIDSVVLDVEPRFHNHTDRKQYGLLYIIPTHDLPRGEHALRIDRLQHLINDRKYNQGATIYFYR